MSFLNNNWAKDLGACECSYFLNICTHFRVYPAWVLYCVIFKRLK